MYQNITWAELTLPVSFLLFCENKNPPQGPLVKSVFISGTVDLQRCVHRFHSQGVGLSGPCPETLRNLLSVGEDHFPLKEDILWGICIFPCCLLGALFFLTELETLFAQTCKALFLASGVQTCLSFWWPAHCVIHKEFFQTLSVYKADFKLWNIQLPVLYPCVLGSVTLVKELDTWYILYCILYCSLCILKEANSKVICEIFFLSIIMSSFLDWQKS